MPITADLSAPVPHRLSRLQTYNPLSAYLAYIQRSASVYCRGIRGATTVEHTDGESERAAYRGYRERHFHRHPGPGRRISRASRSPIGLVGGGADMRTRDSRTWQPGQVHPYFTARQYDAQRLRDTACLYPW